MFLRELPVNRSIKFSVAALALWCAGAAAPAAAEASLQDRAVSALGVAIASQGNAALIQIREDLKRDLLKTLAPLLPRPEAQPAAAAPAPKRDR